MNHKKLIPILLILFNAFAINPAFGQTSENPFRVAVIIGDQWDDPNNQLITPPEGGRASTDYPREADYSGYAESPGITEPSDFYDLMVMLKSWGIPFDVFRLDQQFLSHSMFVNASGEPRYGAIIWDVNRSDSLLSPDFTIIKDIVANEGVGFIALSDRIWQPEIQSILGLEYEGSWMSSEDLEIVKEHFLTKGMESPLDRSDGPTFHKQRMQVKANEAEMLIRQGDYPQVTARTLSSGARTVWIGSDHNQMFSYPDVRTLLRKSITWTVGYNLYRTWEDEAVMIMDDPGNAQNAWLEHWHYPTLSTDTIEEFLIKPLKKHDAVLNINVVAGFVNEKKQRVEPTWRREFTDAFGTRQDYPSTKEGIDQGLKEAVFEIMCHGLTHMQPDLTGWWEAPLNEEKSNVGWYREFGDTRRGKEIPAAEQLWRMNTAKRWLEQQFGVIPLQFCAGGGGSSLSYSNNTWRIAARAGFGWYGWARGYLGKDMAIMGWNYEGTTESPIFTGAPPNGHDFGIAENPEAFTSIFDEYPNKRFININEFIGHLHSGNSGHLERAQTSINLQINYDDHYCSHFKNHQSRWTVEIADWLAEDLGNDVRIEIDGNVISRSQYTGEPFEITIPEGVGEHHVIIEGY
ncbi:MAG: hypothetical protein ACOC90_02850 [Bacteroidota bacterium]